MDKVMSWAEIEATFDSEWVLIEDPELTPMLEIIRGKVVFHGKDKDKLHQKMRELRPLRSAVIFVGDPPKDLEFIL
jgi:hypothetical protein